MQTFICKNCKKEVVTSGHIGTLNRNHCPYCLYSLHVDNTPGDRKAECHGLMKPIGLTFKQEGEGKVGELMLIHVCENCGKISINRLAGDDNGEKVMQVFNESEDVSGQIKQRLQQSSIYLAKEKDSEEIKTQLYGSRSY